MLAGCRGGVQVEANTSGKAEAEVNFDEVEQKGPESGAAAPAGREQVSDLAGAHLTLLGARHDLTLSAEKPAANCQCLAVAVGQPLEGAFRWSAEAPTTDASTQLVVALTSEGLACAGEKGEAFGASYQGYRVEGSDVIVLVENGTAGRPLTQGAVIPKPAQGGHVLVRPTSKSVPYGRGPNGEATCQAQ